MKSFAFALLLLVASAAALSDVSVSELKEQRRNPVTVVTDRIESFTRRIKDSGWDPKEFKRVEGEWSLIHPSFFGASGYVEDFEFTGLSNIVIEDLYYSILTNTLSFNFAMPQIKVTIGDAAGKVSAIGRELNGELSGLLAINNFGVSGRARVIYGWDLSVTIDIVDLSTRLGRIDSNLRIRVLNFDVSIIVNAWLTALPQNLSMYKDLIDRGLIRVVEFVINGRLN